jgi:hypothetical protein
MTIRITSRVDGFRRAGVVHPATPTEHDDGTFDAKQIAALKAEPMLTVEDLGEDGKKSGNKDGA